MAYQYQGESTPEALEAAGYTLNTEYGGGLTYVSNSDGERVGYIYDDGTVYLAEGNTIGAMASSSGTAEEDPFAPDSITSFGNPTGAVVVTPGVIGQDEAAGYISQLSDLIDANAAGTDTVGQYSSNLNDLITGYTNPYEQELSDFTSSYNNPYYDQLDALLSGDTGYSWLTDAQNELINQAYSGRQAQFNALGIGDSPSAQSAIAAAGAGTLSDFYTDYVNSLLGAASGYTTDQGLVSSNLTNLMGTDLSEYTSSTGALQDLINSGQAGLATDLQTLLSMAGFGQPTVSTIGGTE